MKMIFKGIIGLVVIGFLLWGCGLWLLNRSPVQSPQEWGVTFSYTFADAFEGIDWQEAYRAILSDLHVKHLRIPVYWDRVESQKGTYDFSVVDWQLEQAGMYGTDVILAVGRKLPRWPECHIPSWARDLSLEEQNDAVLGFIEQAVQRYRDNDVVRYWQVENEPFLNFGECPDFDAAYVDEAIATVRGLDSRPIVVTDSGELSLWVKAARRADVFGTTMYRHVWHKWVGVYTYPIPPEFFRIKRALTQLIVGTKPMVVIELQAESWLHRQPYETSVSDQFESFNPTRFEEMIAYASQTGFDTFYLWGAEWWYWLKETQDTPQMWEYAKTLFSK
jgi:hypothetical protein